MLLQGLRQSCSHRLGFGAPSPGLFVSEIGLVIAVPLMVVAVDQSQPPDGFKTVLGCMLRDFGLWIGEGFLKILVSKWPHGCFWPVARHRCLERAAGAVVCLISVSSARHDDASFLC